MRKLVLLSLPVLLFMAACNKAPKSEVAAIKPTLDTLVGEFYEDYLKFSPLNATVIGDNRYDSLLPNTLTADYRNQVKELYSRYRDRVTAYDRESLSEDDQMNYDVLLWECDIALDGLKFKDYLMPVNQFSAMHLFVGQMASGASIHPFKTVQDYDNWLKRLHKYEAWCDTALVNMKKGIAEGYVLPKVLVQKTIPQFASMDHGPVKDHLFYAPIKNLPADFSADDKARLTKAYTEMIEKHIIPAHHRIKEFLATDYLKAATDKSGIDAIPGGKDYYNYLIRLYTTTTKPADEIFALGKSEVDRITKEMEAVKEQVGFKGDLQAFFVSLRTKKELTPFTKPEQVIAHFNEIHERMKPNLAKLFSKTPKTPFEVRRTEAFREASASAEYNPGSKDGSRPGVFYVPIPDVKKYNVLSDEDLFLHEAIPGHHYQIALQMENTTLPKFRTITNYSAYAEGWGLYSESLGKELGLYTDPYQYFGMLSAEMHRAIRLVVDAGIHTQGWTREQAIQYSKDHEARTEQSIVAEIERYMAIPGQALSYKIGQLKIRELRAKAEKELGDKFNISEFHNQVLDSGGIPLNVLEGKIDRWIASLKKPA
ncbi:Uncharacterized conserved protein, DUF885 familyt [Chryseolinea serpens]|uniref:Uncharacterized conserved protein, DUF885 familyt n=1 Tax=Chryseolinea serpens TaxID=947013 RepID=A0A1M5KUM8_9BACT|nr:DUF885 domain-containing protein [Chryseolinea serpens]SHG56542.1 Uncharacterized conserved protein, DUF885 familyt [Chryseolinea serpens]